MRQDYVNVGGIGRYTTTLVMPSTIPTVENADPSAVCLSLPPFSNTARAWVNNKQPKLLNPSGGRVEISQYLTGHAEDHHTIEITTTVFNRVKADADKIIQVSTPVSFQSSLFSHGATGLRASGQVYC
jgi:hypothetical protein